MEAVARKNDGTAKIVRRFVAILLVGLAILSLFWPSVIAVGGTLRKDLQASVNELETYLDRNAYDIADRYGSREAYIYRATSEYMLDYFRLNAQKAQQAKEEELSNFFSNAYYIFGTLRENVAPRINFEFYNTIYRSLKNCGLSFEEFREIFTQLPYFAEKTLDYNPQHTDQIKPVATAIKYGNICYNVLFFLVIALAAAAIVLMFMNRSKFWVVLFTIFAVLFAGIFLALWIFLLVKDFHLFIPGVSMFALPILAIAACIVYQRDKRYSGIFPKRERKEHPVARIETPSEPMPQSYAAPVFTPVEPVKEAPAEEPAPENGWTCPSCHAANDADSNFCTYCGTQKPAAPAFEETKEPVCPNCGAPLNEGAKFCTKCGTRVNV